jgi:aspartoacylase
MAASVLLVTGTHGNERNGPWLQDQWLLQPSTLQRPGLRVQSLLGNPAAFAQNSRYLDRDLNRSFTKELLQLRNSQELEVHRAQELLACHGPAGSDPAQVLLDLHSTTAAMGSCLVVYGERPADLALAAACQGQLGLPIYLHGTDSRQNGFMVSQWPCGLVLEVGPVPQGVVAPLICSQTALGVNCLLDLLSAAFSAPLQLPAQLVVHRHLRSLDLPRDADGRPTACLHPERLRGDWRPLKPGDPLFLSAAGNTIQFTGNDTGSLSTVFSNEAAYQEKQIALSVTRREQLAPSPAWAQALTALLRGSTAY